MGNKRVAKKVRRHLRTGKPFFAPREDSYPRVGKRLAKHGWNYDYDVGTTERGGWVKGKPNNPGYKQPIQPGFALPGQESGLARMKAQRKALRKRIK